MIRANRRGMIVIIIIMLINLMSSIQALTFVKQSEPITSVKAHNKVAAIACNVYEGEALLPEMMDILDRYNVRISFFIGGVWARRNPETLMLLKERGHDLQNHGYNHRLPTRLDKASNIKEIKDTEKLIEEITGVRTNLFEPPSGDYDSNTLSLMDELGYRMVTWSADTIDWRGDATREKILSRIDKKLQPGCIILMHPKKVTAESLESVLRYLKDKDYRVTTVTDILSEM